MNGPYSTTKLANVVVAGPLQAFYPGLVRCHKGHFSIDTAVFTGVDDGLKVGSAA
jgi:hypothetical protein